MRRFYLSVVDKPLVDTKKGLPDSGDLFSIYSSVDYIGNLMAACAAAKRAMGTRKGEQET